MRIAITGGTGFVGAAAIDHLLNQGHEVAALARDAGRLRRAGDVRVVEGDLENTAALAALARNADAFVHLAGITHARRDEDYEKVNVAGAANAAKAAAQTGAKFIHISSMSARAPSVSPYARSKADSEEAVREASGRNPWLALRLPAIYGPGDMVTLDYFKLIRAGLALEPRTAPPARASLLYVDDAAAAILTAAEAAEPGCVYEVGDERMEGFAWSEIGALLGETLGKPARRIRLPRPVIAVYHGALRRAERLLKRPPSVRTGQINEFFHPDWVARENLLAEATPWRPATPLHEGFAKTVRWYQENGLL
ncbi:MAG: NAD-dependent epimerase/dehydratase family protein [Pseudomonadota bacterium]